MMICADDPVPGFYKRRLVKGGVFVPARIWWEGERCPETGELVEDERLRCELDGLPADPHEQWPWLAANPISEAEFRYLTALRTWTLNHAPSEPYANPRRPVNWRDVPTPF